MKSFKITTTPLFHLELAGALLHRTVYGTFKHLDQYVNCGIDGYSLQLWKRTFLSKYQMSK